MPLTRRTLLRQAATVSAATLARRALALPETAAAPARLTLHPGQTLATIPTNFLGLGYEISSVSRPGVFGPGGDYVNLVRALSPEGVIRVGGNTADFATFSPTGPSVSAPKATAVNQADLDRLRQFLDATGWQLIWSVNLGSGTAQADIDAAVEEAVAVARTFGPRLLALEIGNEPDLFFIEHRPKPYTYEQFRSEYIPFRDAILHRLPDLPLAGPDAAVANTWVRRFAADEPQNLKLLTQHYYREGQNPTSTPASSTDKLLRPDPKLPAALAELRSVSQATGLPHRICEVNSFSGGGRPGVSNTFASALWVLDYMLLLAQNGCSGVNLETGVNQLGFVSSYSPIFENPDRTLTARPEYYGMAAFAQATGLGGLIGSTAPHPSNAHAALSPCDLDGRPRQRSPPTRSSTRSTQFTAILINKDAAADLSCPDPRSRQNKPFASSVRADLTAPSLDCHLRRHLSAVKRSLAISQSDNAALASRVGTDRLRTLHLPRAASAALVRSRPSDAKRHCTK